MGVKISLGKFISTRRKQKFMTQEELANKMHVSKSAIAKWETDGGVPDRDNLYRLAEIIGVSVDAMHHIMAGNASFEEKEIAPMIEGIPLVAHNSMFDEGCLKAVFRLYEMDYPGYSFYCTYRLSRKLFKGLENYQLHTVSSFCGYDLKNHHHALADAEAAAVIMQSILQQCPDL